MRGGWGGGRGERGKKERVGGLGERAEDYCGRERIGREQIFSCVI